MTRTTTTTTATLAVAADYADALMTARRAKNWLFLLLLLILIVQIGVFFAVKFNALHLNDTVALNTTGASATDTQPSAVGTGTIHYTRIGEILRYVIPWFDFLGIVFAVTLCIVLLLLTGIMLVGRLIGVSQVTSAFIWSVFLALLLFPWQAFLISGERYYTTAPGTAAYATSADVPPDQPAFKIPGVLYTYPELYQDGHFANQPLQQAVLKWGRFAGFPIVAVLLLLVVQQASSRGLKFALGESEMHVEVGTRPSEPVV